MENTQEVRPTNQRQIENSVEAYADSVASEVCFKFNPEMQNKFVKDFINAMRKKRIDKTHETMKDLHFLSEQFFACP
jgi:UDP-N-acetylenolpyruvoylglucosamine reductase